MNIIDIILIVVVLLIVLHGYFKGFLVSVLSLAKYLLGIPLCYYAAKGCGEPLYNALLRETLSNSVAKTVESTGLDSAVVSIRDAVNTFPDALKNAVDLSFLNNVNAANAAKGIMENVVDPVAILICKIVLFIVVVIVFLILSGILIAVIDKASKKDDAPFKDTNKFLGAALGAVKAFIILFAVAAIGDFLVTYFSGSSAFIDQLGSSAVIGFINKFNPLLMI